jgi:osmotically-inducible protein OsmY
MLGPRSAGVGTWVYPYDRYYYGWYDELRGEQPSDHQIKSTVVDRLRENPYTRDDDLKVDVEQGVVILQGKVSSPRSKRAAGDDAWDTPGVSDVSNQLVVVS